MRCGASATPGNASHRRAFFGPGVNRQSRQSIGIWIRMVVALQSLAPQMPTTVDQTRHDGCPACTHVNPPGSLFCNACGVRLAPQPSVGTTAREAPRPWFHTPLIPDDVRQSLGPLALPGAPKQPVSSTSEPMPSVSDAPASAEAPRTVPHGRAVPPVESQPATRAHPRVAAYPAARLQSHNAAQRPPPAVARRYDRPKSTLVRALLAAALIACLAIGAALFRGEAWQALVRSDAPSTARQQSEQTSNAGTVTSRPIDEAAPVGAAPSLNGTPVSPETPRSDASEATSSVGDSPQAAVGDGKERTTPDVNVGQSPGGTPDLAPPTTTTAGATGDTSASQLGSGTSAGTSRAPVANPRITAQQSRQAGSRSDKAPHQPANDCPIQLRTLGLCRSPSDR